MLKAGITIRLVCLFAVLVTPAAGFVEGLRPGDKVAVISFGEKVELLTGPTNDRGALSKAIRGVPAGNSTPLYDAVDFVLRRLFAGVAGRKAVVLLTDGLDNGGAAATAEGSMYDAEELDVLVYPVQYDPSVDETRAFATSLNRPPELRSEREVKVRHPNLSVRTRSSYIYNPPVN